MRITAREGSYGDGERADRVAPQPGLRALGAAALLAVTACGGPMPSLEELAGADDCRQTLLVGHPARALDTLETEEAREAALVERAVEWRLPPESVDVARLNAWCAAVGPAVVGGWADTAPATPVVDTLWLVSWNLRVGGGDVDAFVEDLRAGRLTDGRPVRDFVLLLQETYRASPQLPTYDRDRPGGSETTPTPPNGARRDAIRAAEAHGLWLAYVPSMRNGPAEDRGNAILSTLRLRSPTAVALPVARQRRVAVVASVTASTAAGRHWRLQLSSVHLESSPAGLRSDEVQRLEQAEALVSLLPDADAAVAAGDFNTKARGQDEALVHVMLSAFPDTPPFPPGATYRRLFGVYREYLDYMFFRLPAGVEARYTRVPRTYGSDHYPLVARVVW